MASFIQTVSYEIESGDITLFRAAVMQHAETTRQRMPGCTRFDVSFGAGSELLCLTYAVFVDGATFDEYATSDHTHVFEDVSEAWVISRTEQLWELGASARRLPGV